MMMMMMMMMKICTSKRSASILKETENLSRASKEMTNYGDESTVN